MLLSQFTSFDYSGDADAAMANVTEEPTYAQLTSLSYSAPVDSSQNASDAFRKSLFDELDGFYQSEQKSAAPVQREEESESDEEPEEDRQERFVSEIKKKIDEGKLDDPEMDTLFEDVRQQNIISRERVKMIKQMLKEEQKLPSFFCVVCSKVFHTAEDLKRHTTTDHDTSSKLFKCSKCGQGFKHKKNLVAHAAKHSQSLGHECQECHMILKSEISLEAHMNRQHLKATDGSEFENCEFCSESFPTVQLKRHEYYCRNKERIQKQRLEKKSLSVPSSPAFSVASISSFTSAPMNAVSPRTASYIDKRCTVCDLECASRQSMLRHVARKHPESLSDPNVVDLRFISVNSPDHPYLCADCGKRFTTRAALTTHKNRLHLQQLQFKCKTCDKSYPLAAELRKHEKRVHETRSTTTIGEDLFSDF